ncbi:ribose 1,5-bisphosphokinase [Marinomonas sp. C2222]|uniref:Ribose 1,5-bisphosphate phosphokinase PhnN n=1 Tax=Marinomonas sargassi TaxID=2984494 RepID=A0ABT2YPL8_9GAMM|nr:ribose 1,5-bisphosphokinase [Marinomonas sargassi]MCV2401827.1 ribose 1,5-bisphosphokinase [Marinomonas sargassi]
MGKIIYLIGASGSGKDAILSWLRQTDSSKLNLMIAHRYICRDWQSGNENHIELSQSEFLRRQALGGFALSWQANGLYYGIGRELDFWLEQEQVVVVNGSREYLATALSLYGDALKPLLIQVDPDVLRQRLIARGRESLADIEARLKRNQTQNQAALLDKCHVIHNNTSIEEAGQQFISLVHSLVDMES